MERRRQARRRTSRKDIGERIAADRWRSIERRRRVSVLRDELRWHDVLSDSVEDFSAEKEEKWGLCCTSVGMFFFATLL